MADLSTWKPRFTLAEGIHLTCEVDGRVLTVFKNLWPSLRLYWLWVTKENGDKTLAVYENQRYNYKELLNQSITCAAVFKDVYGVKKGDRIAICSRNYPSYYVVWWACHLLGAVAVLVNAMLPLAPLQHCLTLTDCKIIILDPERADLVEKSSMNLKSALLVLESHEGKGSWKGMDSLAKTMAEYKGDASQVIKQDPGVQPDDNATVIFTSGTTGLPKGVLCSQRGLLTNIFNVAASSGRDLLRRGAKFPPDPLGGMFLGMKIVMMRKWVVAEAVRLVKAENVTLLGAVPSTISDLAENTTGDSPIASITYGGAAVAKSLNDGVRKAFPAATIAQGYGLTETSAAVVSFAGPDYQLRPTSAGAALPVMELLIMKDDVKVPTNTIGEIWLRGPAIMKGYWGDPVATDKVLSKDGWLKTGDFGYVDEDGFLYIKDRIKDIIIRGGENIDSISVENALYAYPGVLEAAAVGVPDK
ncbi:acetyl-CoA synthetase-like protein, partial [Hymenopellis radicata]